MKSTSVIFSLVLLLYSPLSKAFEENINNVNCILESNKNETLNLHYIFTGSYAYLISTLDVKEVKLIPNKYGISFLEITETGNIMVTTINQATMEAVHSRNSLISDITIPSQYYGVCTLN